MLLELDGFQVKPCLTIEQAVEAATEETDVFIIDCNLSRGTNGLDLLRQIRDDNTDAQPNTIVVMTSGDIRRQEVSMILKANLFLLKPYPPEDLSTTLNKLLN